MKIEKQVCTFEQAKKLKELGIDQSSYFVMGESRQEILEGWMLDGNEDEFVAMFTVTELGVMLPQGYHTYNTGFPGSEEWGAMDDEDEDITDSELVCIMAPTEAQARARTLIHLLEINKITSAEANDQLQKASA